MRKITLYHALMIVLIVGIGLLIWQTVLLRRTVANQTVTLEHVISESAFHPPPVARNLRQGEQGAIPVYVVNSVNVR